MSPGENISPFGDRWPRIHPQAFVDRSARVIGDVRLETEASVWPMAVIRADSEAISIGPRAAVLDLAMVEAPEAMPVVIEERSIVSHGAIIHGALLRARVLIGLGAMVLDGAEIGSGSIVGAGCLVTAGTVIPPNSLVLGTPGRVTRETTPEEREKIEAQVLELYDKSRVYLADSSEASRISR